MKNFTAVIERDADTGLYVGWVPGFPGAHSQGQTLDELRANLQEVVEMLLEEAIPGSRANSSELRPSKWRSSWGSRQFSSLVRSWRCLGSWGFLKFGNEALTDSFDIQMAAGRPCRFIRGATFRRHSFVRSQKTSGCPSRTSWRHNQPSSRTPRCSRRPMRRSSQ